MRLAAPVIRLAMTNGSIISCSSLMNISPGYASRDIIEDDNERDRSENPRMTPSKTPKNVITNRRLDLNHPQTLVIIPSELSKDFNIISTTSRSRIGPHLEAPLNE